MHRGFRVAGSDYDRFIERYGAALAAELSAFARLPAAPARVLDAGCGPAGVGPAGGRGRT